MHAEINFRQLHLKHPIRCPFQRKGTPSSRVEFKPIILAIVRLPYAITTEAPLCNHPIHTYLSPCLNQIKYQIHYDISMHSDSNFAFMYAVKPL